MSRYQHHIPVPLLHTLHCHIPCSLCHAGAHRTEYRRFDGVNMTAGISHLGLRINDAADRLLHSLCVGGSARVDLEMSRIQGLDKLLLAGFGCRAGEVVHRARRALVGILKQPDHALGLCKVKPLQSVFDIETAVVGQSLDAGILEDTLDLRVGRFRPALYLLLHSVQMSPCGLIDL